MWSDIHATLLERSGRDVEDARTKRQDRVSSGQVEGPDVRRVSAGPQVVASTSVESKATVGLPDVPSTLVTSIAAPSATDRKRPAHRRN